jgi:AcrR family transcriptional regulator
LAVNRDHDAFGPAESPGSEADRNGADTAGEGGSAEPRGPGAPVAWPAEESDGRAVRAQARREQRRSTILAAATRVFKDKGYHAASVNDIIDAAQIARGTFYLYFTSKREVFAELSATFLGLIRGSVQKISLDPADGEPLTQMRANFRRVMNTVLEHGDLATIMLRGDAGDAEARAQLEVFYRQVVDLIGQAVRVGHALGFARDCDVDIIAVAALAGLKEVMGRMLDARHELPGASAGLPEERGETAVSRAREGALEVEVEVAGPTQARGELAGAGRSVGAVTVGERTGSPWLMAPERLADELVTFFVRGVFTEDAR